VAAIEIDATGRSTRIESGELVTPEPVALDVIDVVPADTPVTVNATSPFTSVVPVVGDTVATDVLAIAMSTGRPGNGLLEASSTVTLPLTVPNVAFDTMSESRGTVAVTCATAASTVMTDGDAETVASMVALTLVDPGATPVTWPVVDPTVATAGALELQVGVRPPSGLPDAVPMVFPAESSGDAERETWVACGAPTRVAVDGVTTTELTGTRSDERTSVSLTVPVPVDALATSSSPATAPLVATMVVTPDVVAVESIVRNDENAAGTLHTTSCPGSTVPTASFVCTLTARR